ncbi:serine/threonine-protein kinase B [Microcystis aeruginosa NIES-4325]|uniref:Serine/threonine-protein kinase B n=1 Tax=Microcystis aeruginosa NIES-4325 TaxID=2569534 RepID=A0A5J4F7N7_MICAE|nr:pentapeptide repeat-containing protein [Microcystis aeruginosa]GEA26969.1 serine/threonine-protein kinase B [Microcystis aeruginosa NIES-4325]
MRLLAAFDRYPDSVSLTLEPVATDSQKFDLYLTLHLQAQIQSLLAGEIKWGLKGGKLDFLLVNCHLTLNPLSSQDLYINPINNHQWRLSFKSPQSIFTGAIERINLGTVSVEEEPYHLTVQFSLTAADICITETSGLWKHDISPNKHSILERKLAFFLMENQFDAFLSRISLGSSQVELDTVLVEPQPAASENLDKLPGQIERIYAAVSDDFLELAQLAELDHLTDFTGANLLAAELSGISLGMANLYQANLRGANLTDADLSEINGSYASFKGADLSGALLANADLSYADFYRSSLALANLIGSNLEGANLVEVNITQANFSGAKVKGAKFADNVGMTEELRENLRLRGAFCD